MHRSHSFTVRQIVDAAFGDHGQQFPRSHRSAITFIRTITREVFFAESVTSFIQQPSGTGVDHFGADAFLL